MRFNDEDGEVHEVRVADASDGLRGEPAQRYSVHVQVREMWLHDEENVEAAADAMKRPLSTLRSARRGTSLQLRVGDRLDDANGGVGGHRWTPEHGGREDRLCLRAASGRSWHEAGDGLGGARGDHGAEEGVSRPDPILNELARIEALRAELRRLRGEVLRLEEDNRVLQERIAFLVRELEQMRAKVPRGISTS